MLTQKQMAIARHNLEVGNSMRNRGEPVPNSFVAKWCSCGAKECGIIHWTIGTKEQKNA